MLEESTKQYSLLNINVKSLCIVKINVGHSSFQCEVDSFVTSLSDSIQRGGGVSGQCRCPDP